MSTALKNQILADLNAPKGDAKEMGHKTALFDHQIKVLAPILKEGKKLVFSASGRKNGKTFSVMYLAWYWALMNPNSSVYICCPESTHAKKIYWKDGRIYAFLGKETQKYILGKPNSRELTIYLKNGSNIQLIGSENYMSANGLTPHLVIYDEFKGFHPEFHTTMDPNRSAKSAPLFVIGTLADPLSKNRDEYEALLKYAKEHPEESSVFTMTTFDNPLNKEGTKNHVAIMKQIALLRAQGKEHVVQREYYSKIIPGGDTALFPQFDKNKHSYKHEDLVKEIFKDRNSMNWCVSIDPASRTVFGGLVGCVDPYTSTIYILDEIYAKKEQDTLISKIAPQLLSKMMDLYPEGNIEYDWAKVCDEQGAWAILAILEMFPNMAFMASQKHYNKKPQGIQLINEAITRGLLKISDRCVNLIKEMEEYQRNKNGNIPKINDHNIDCLRYLLGHLNYSIVPIVEDRRDLRKSNAYEDFDPFGGW